MASVVFDRVSKVFDDGTRAVDRLDLGVADAEFIVLVGPSGCGKTTALRMLAGLEEISQGSIRIGDRVVNGLTPKSRDIAMVFQSYALYPHLSVYDNIAFPLKITRTSKDEIRRRVAEAVRILDLEPLLKRKPRALSGGQRQRVAMGRAIVRQPQAFLLDEPLSNLDAKLRVQMRADIKKLQSELAVTTIYVTHDQVEAMTMGDRVAVMKDGVLQQVDAPQRLYDLPANLFVAGFIGSPPMNLLEAKLSSQDGAVTVTLAGSSIPVGDDAKRAYPGLREFRGDSVVVGVRARDLHPAAERPDLPTLNARVELVEALGGGSLAYFWIDAMALARDGETVTNAEGEAAGAVGGTQPNLVAEFPPHATLTIGDSVRVAIDPARLHFFDGASGEPLR